MSGRSATPAGSVPSVQSVASGKSDSSRASHSTNHSRASSKSNKSKSSSASPKSIASKKSQSSSPEVEKNQQGDSDNSDGSMIGRKKRQPIRKNYSVSGNESSDKEEIVKKSGSEASEKCKFIISQHI